MFFNTVKHTFFNGRMLIVLIDQSLKLDDVDQHRLEHKRLMQLQMKGDNLNVDLSVFANHLL